MPAWWLDKWRPPSRFEGESRTFQEQEVSLRTYQINCELPFHPYFLSEVQRQLLDSTKVGPNDLHLDFGRIYSNGYFNNPALNSEFLERSAEAFCNLKVRCEKDGKIGYERLFNSEKWEFHNGRPEGVSVQISSKTRELLSGMSDGHMDLYRSCIGDSTAAEFISNRPPVSLNLQLWSNLSAIERPIYLNLLQTSYGQGTNGYPQEIGLLPLEELFVLENASRFKSGEVLSTLEQLSFLLSLSRKIANQSSNNRSEHGAQKFGISISNSDHTALGWSLPVDPDKHVLESEYLGRIFYGDMLRTQYTSEMCDLWTLVSRLLPTKSLSTHLTWSIVRELPGAIIKIGSGRIAHLHNLFMEWTLRQSFTSDFKLTDDVRHFFPLRYCSIEGDIKANFERFMTSVRSSGEFAQFISDHPNCSWAMGSEHSLREALNALNSSQRDVSSEVRKPFEMNSGLKISMLPSLKDSVSVKAGLDLRPFGDQNGEQSGVGRDLALESKLMRIAQDELDKMLKMDRISFEALKETYLLSLEEDQRQLVFDVQRRMRPLLFDQQLKPRLVRFMVAHPGQWKSTQTALQ